MHRYMSVVDLGGGGGGQQDTHTQNSLDFVLLSLRACLDVKA